MIQTAAKPRGIFLNQRKAQCSIWESGLMAYRALKYGQRYTLDYLEIAEDAFVIPPADFYVFNYHHSTMGWLKTDPIAQLPGKKFTIVLEMLPGDPFVFVDPTHFDAYIVLDPTMNVEQKNVYAFPRPLEEATNAIRPYVEKDIPWIGTFGFCTPGKGFEHVVEAVNREFDRARVRINIPIGTYADKHGERYRRSSYADYLAELCRQVAKPGIEVDVTREFMTKDELIDWCSENTLNCFLYSRDQAGLSATTDQCITAGRPLAVSFNETFRHIHQYLEPYPRLSLQDSIRTSIPSVRKMREDWAPQSFARRFESLLADFELLPMTGHEAWSRPTPVKREQLLVAATPEMAPADRLSLQTFARCVNKSKLYAARCEVIPDSATLEMICESLHMDAVVTLSTAAEWLRSAPKRIIALVPPGGSAATGLKNVFFEPCDSSPTLPRLIPLHSNLQPIPKVTLVGGYFLGPSYDSAVRLVERVSRELEKALVAIYMPVDSIDARIKEQVERIQNAAAPGIKIEFVHAWNAPQNLLTMMSLSSINFVAGERPEDLLLLEYALATQRPVAVERSPWFERFEKLSPSSFLEPATLPEILERGIAPLVPVYNEYSELRFLMRAEAVLDSLLTDGKSTDNLTLEIEKLRSSSRTTETLSNRILARSFILKAVKEALKGKTNPRALAVGSFDDPIARELETAGVQLDEIDPRLNFDLDTFYALPTTGLWSYDVIFAPSGIEDVEDIEMFLAQLGDLLAPGGRLVLTCALSTPEGKNRRGYKVQEIEHGFLSVLQGCSWAEAPVWGTPTNDEPGIAHLIIEKPRS